MYKMCAVVKCTKDAKGDVLIQGKAGAVLVVPLCPIHLQVHKSSGSVLSNE